MPFVSKDQEKMAFARHLPFADEWAKMTNFKSLPQHVAAKRLRQKGLANERRHRLAANKKTPFNVMEGK